MISISKLEQQLLQLSPRDRLYLIQVLAQSLNGLWKPTPQPITDSLSSFFQRSPLADAVAEEEEFDLSRDRSLSSDRLIL